MKPRIVSVGCSIPKGAIEQHSFSFRPKLDDEDILLISPNQTPATYHYQHGTYHGKPCLNEELSEQILADKEFWENVILKRVMTGKNVFVFLEKPEQYYIHTGEVRRLKTESRNETFSLVTLFHTYSLLPAEVGYPLPVSDQSPQSECTDPLFQKLGERFSGEFLPKAYFLPAEFGGIAGVIHPVSKTVLGGSVDVYSGRIILLPALDFERPEYLSIRDGREIWSEHATAFVSRLAETLERMDQELKRAPGQNATPAITRFDIPEDATLTNIDRKAVLGDVNKIETKISDLTRQIETLKRQHDQLCVEKEEKVRLEQEPRKLVFEVGAELHKIVEKTLSMIGMEQEQLGFMLSVTATDNQEIGHEMVNDLWLRIQSQFVRDSSHHFLKGILVANAFRNLDPQSRPDYFSAKCIALAAHHGFALIRSEDLVSIYKNLCLSKDPKYANLCQDAIMRCEGSIVRFPSKGTADEAAKRDVQQRSKRAMMPSLGSGRFW